MAACGIAAKCAVPLCRARSPRAELPGARCVPRRRIVFARFQCRRSRFPRWSLRVEPSLRTSSPERRFAPRGSGMAIAVKPFFSWRFQRATQRKGAGVAQGPIRIFTRIGLARCGRKCSCVRRDAAPAAAPLESTWRAETKWTVQAPRRPFRGAGSSFHGADRFWSHPAMPRERRIEA